MASKRGSLSINSDNIFPIIKSGYIPTMTFSSVN